MPDKRKVTLHKPTWGGRASAVGFCGTGRGNSPLFPLTKIKGAEVSHFEQMPPIRMLVSMYAPKGERLAKKPEKPTTHYGGIIIHNQSSGNRWDSDSHSRRSLGAYSWQDTGSRRSHPHQGTTDLVLLNPRKGTFPGGNLKKHEYQHWIGSVMENMKFSTCRVCNITTDNELGRRQHFVAGQCGRVMMEAIKSFEAAHYDVCACSCTRSRKVHLWGLGFHTTDCIKAFAFRGETSIVLRRLIQVEKDKWCKKLQ